MRPHVIRFCCACLASVLCAAFGFGARAAETKQPYEIIRSLEALHDQMVLGSRGAQSTMPKVLRQLGSRLMNVDAAVWKDARNTRAIVIYILSGGEVRVARKVLETGKVTAAERQLIEGALAYLEGLKPQARGLLENIDPRSVEPALGSHLALAQAALAAEEKPAKAMNLLDLARVLAPGTLVEDAALRREVFLAEQTVDFDKFVAMADQYFRRFARSVYAENFKREFTIALTRISQSGSDRQLTSLSRLLRDLPPQEQLRLYLHMAEVSVINGKAVATKWAAAEAERIAPANSSETSRAVLYDGAVSVLTADYEGGMAKLQTLASVHLPANDALLRDAAIDMAHQIRQWPAPPTAKFDEESDGPPTLGPAPKVPGPVPGALAPTVQSTDDAIAHAEKMLADSKALLEGQGQ